jgi:ABC-2 type transport system ATP-binding protein
MHPSITIRGLTKTYPGGVTAVHDLDLEVPAGSIFGFLGANGAGKTSTMRIVAGLAHETAGTVEVDGISRRAGAEYLRHVGYLAQEPAFYGWMTGREVLGFVSRFHGRDSGTEARIGELLALVGLADDADRRTVTYSGGMRQRLGIAQALVGQPSVVVLDEPVSGLDPIGRRDVLELMTVLRGSTTVFYSTHILDDVQRVADHVAILDHGSLVVAASTADLLARATEGRLRVVLAGASAATADRLRALPGIAAVSPVPDDSGDGQAAFDVRVADGRIPEAQFEVTRFAAAEGLAVLTSRPDSLDLEAIFLSLVDPKEHAA